MNGRFTSFRILGLSFLLLANRAGATFTTWDPQGTTGGYPYTGSLNGPWESDDWSTSQSGQVTPQNWIEGTAALFAVNTGPGTPAFTVTMNSNHTVAGIFDGPEGPNPCLATIQAIVNPITAQPGFITLPVGLQEFFVTSDTSNPGSLTLNVDIADGGRTNSGALLCEGNGTISLNGTNAYYGGTFIGGSNHYFSGTLNFNNSASFGIGGIAISNTYTNIAILAAEGTNALTIPNNVTNSSAVARLDIYGNAAGVTFSGNWFLNTNLNLGSGGPAANLVIISGVISGPGNLQQFDVGTLALTGVNTFTGNIISSGAGQLIIAGTGQLGNGAYSGIIYLTNGETFIYSSSAAQTLTGVISGTGALTQNSGRLTLTARNTYTGPTAVNGGTLLLSGGSLSTGTVTVNSGATLGLWGYGGAINGPTAINAGGTLTTVDDTLDTLTFGGNLTLSGATCMEVLSSGGVGYSDQIIMAGGTLTMGGNLTVTNILGTLVSGETFRLFSGTLAGGFGSISLPALTPGLAWDVSQLVPGGNGSVSVVPVATPVMTNFTITGGCPQFDIHSQLGISWQVQYSTDLTNWNVLTNLNPAPQSFIRIIDYNSRISQLSQVYYRTVPYDPFVYGMNLIPAGAFMMGNCMNPNEGNADELPVHIVYTSAFYIETNLVTGELWNSVCQWAINHGYTFDGSVQPNDLYPISIDWYEAVGWCNARSQKEGLVPVYYSDAGFTQLCTNLTIENLGVINGNFYADWTANGYRLPTEAEWEKAARGGAAGHRFPWSDTDTISQLRADYYGNTSAYSYDLGPNGNVWGGPLPVGIFPPNGYGLYDMAGNAEQWCWDYHDPGYYSVSVGLNAINPRGGGGGINWERILRGGGAFDNPSLIDESPGPNLQPGAYYARCSVRVNDDPGFSDCAESYPYNIVPCRTDFRCVRLYIPPLPSPP